MFWMQDFGSNNVALQLFKTRGDANAAVSLATGAGGAIPGIFFGPGGGTALDVSIARSGAATADVTGEFSFLSTITAKSRLDWSRTGSLTAAQTFAQLTSSWTYATTTGMTNVFINYAPTQTWSVAPGGGVVMDEVFVTAATYKNSGAVNLPAVWSFWANYTKTADTNTGINYGGNIDFQATPTFTTASTGTYTAGSHIALSAGLTTATNSAACTLASDTGVAYTLAVGATTTVTTATALKVTAPTVTGTLTNFVGVDLPAMTAAATLNIGIRNAPALVLTPTTITVTTNAATIPVSCCHAKLSNSSAAAMTVTLTTTNAQDGQELRVKIYDFSAASQTVTFTNSETGGAGAPPATFGSTTIATTYRFIFNSTSSKWTYCSR